VQGCAGTRASDDYVTREFAEVETGTPSSWWPAKARWKRFAANVLPIIREAQKAGAATLREIAAALNARGVATARGGQWHAKSVANVLDRA
jgi:hypothetical protein